MNCKFKSAIAIFMIALSFNSTTFAGTNNMGNGSDYEFYIDVVGKKVWIDDDDNDGIRPEKIIIPDLFFIAFSKISFDLLVKPNKFWVFLKFSIERILKTNFSPTIVFKVEILKSMWGNFSNFKYPSWGLLFSEISSFEDNLILVKSLI